MWTFQLVLAGGGASDDPEGAVVLKEVQEAAGEDPDIIILELPPWSALEINALQRASTIVVQKSLKEGFGLTVTEALWKSKPTIASAVGGIPYAGDRQADGRTGSFGGGMRISNSLPAHASGIRCPAGAQWPGTCQRKLFDDNQCPALGTVVSHSIWIGFLAPADPSPLSTDR